MGRRGAGGGVFSHRPRVTGQTLDSWPSEWQRMRTSSMLQQLNSAGILPRESEGERACLSRDIIDVPNHGNEKPAAPAKAGLADLQGLRWHDCAALWSISSEKHICSSDAEVTRESRLKWLLRPRLTQDAAKHASHERVKLTLHKPTLHSRFDCARVEAFGHARRGQGLVAANPNHFGRRHATALYSLPVGRVSAVPQ